MFRQSILKAYDLAKEIFGRDGSPSRPQSKTDASETRPYHDATIPSSAGNSKRNSTA